MKNSENEKTRFPSFVDVRDYLSNTMRVKKNPTKFSYQGKSMLFNTYIEKSANRPFDLLAHILEG